MASKSPWIPLESNPEWAKRAGLVTSQYAFGDVYGLDDELLDIVPQPTRAVVLLFPDIPEARTRQKEEDARIAERGQPLLDPTIFFVKQTISNACGTIALIHALANSDVTWSVDSPLRKYILDCQDKSPEERAQILESTAIFSDIHAESAQGGQSAPHLDTDLHFICFVAAPDADLRKVASGERSPTQVDTSDASDTGLRLIELDGRRAAPIDRGVCTNLLKDVAKIVKDRYLTKTESLNFSLMALGPSTED